MEQIKSHKSGVTREEARKFYASESYSGDFCHYNHLKLNKNITAYKSQMKKFDNIDIRKTMIHQMQYNDGIQTEKAPSQGGFRNYRKKIDYLKFHGLDFKTLDTFIASKKDSNGYMNNNQDLYESINNKLGFVKVAIGNAPTNTQKVYKRADT